MRSVGSIPILLPVLKAKMPLSILKLCKGKHLHFGLTASLACNKKKGLNMKVNTNLQVKIGNKNQSKQFGSKSNFGLLVWVAKY